MQIQSINSYKSSVAASSWNTGELTALQPQADRFRLLASAGFRKPEAKEAKEIAKTNYAQSTMGRDLVSFKGFSYKQLPVDQIVDVVKKDSNILKMEDDILNAASNRAKALKGLEGSAAYDRLKAANQKMQASDMTKRADALRDIFAKKGIGEIVTLLQEQVDDYAARQLSQPLEKCKGKLDEAIKLRDRLDDTLLGIERAYNNTPFVERKETINREIMKFLNNSGGRKYVSEFKKLEAELLTKAN